MELGEVSSDRVPRAPTSAPPPQPPGRCSPAAARRSGGGGGTPPSASPPRPPAPAADASSSSVLALARSIGMGSGEASGALSASGTWRAFSGGGERSPSLLPSTNPYANTFIGTPLPAGLPPQREGGGGAATPQRPASDAGFGAEGGLHFRRSRKGSGSSLGSAAGSGVGGLGGATKAPSPSHPYSLTAPPNKGGAANKAPIRSGSGGSGRGGHGHAPRALSGSGNSSSPPLPPPPSGAAATVAPQGAYCVSPVGMARTANGRSSSFSRPQHTQHQQASTSPLNHHRSGGSMPLAQAHAMSAVSAVDTIEEDIIADDDDGAGSDSSFELAAPEEQSASERPVLFHRVEHWLNDKAFALEVADFELRGGAGGGGGGSLPSAPLVLSRPRTAQPLTAALRSAMHMGNSSGGGGGGGPSDAILMGEVDAVDGSSPTSYAQRYRKSVESYARQNAFDGGAVAAGAASSRRLFAVDDAGFDPLLPAPMRATVGGERSGGTAASSGRNSGSAPAGGGCGGPASSTASPGGAPLSASNNTSSSYASPHSAPRPTTAEAHRRRAVRLATERLWRSRVQSARRQRGDGPSARGGGGGGGGGGSSDSSHSSSSDGSSSESDSSSSD